MVDNNSRVNYLLTNQETTRLKFRKLEYSDFEIWIEFFKDEDTTRMLGMQEFKTPQERCEEWFEWTFNRYANNLGGQNVLIEKSTNKFVGQSGLLLREIDGKMEIEVAYSILSEYRNKGFAGEASKKCIDYAFENEFNERLLSIIALENIKSQNVAISNGMSFKKDFLYDTKMKKWYEITREEWLNHK